MILFFLLFFSYYIHANEYKHLRSIQNKNNKNIHIRKKKNILEKRSDPILEIYDKSKYIFLNKKPVFKDEKIKINISFSNEKYKSIYEKYKKENFIYMKIVEIVDDKKIILIYKNKNNNTYINAKLNIKSILNENLITTDHLYDINFEKYSQTKVLKHTSIKWQDIYSFYIKNIKEIEFEFKKKLDIDFNKLVSINKKLDNMIYDLKHSNEEKKSYKKKINNLFTTTLSEGHIYDIKGNYLDRVLKFNLSTNEFRNNQTNIYSGYISYNNFYENITWSSKISWVLLDNLNLNKIADKLQLDFNMGHLSVKSNYLIKKELYFSFEHMGDKKLFYIRNYIYENIFRYNLNNQINEIYSSADILGGGFIGIVPIFFNRLDSLIGIGIKKETLISDLYTRINLAYNTYQGIRLASEIKLIKNVYSGFYLDFITDYRYEIELSVLIGYIELGFKYISNYIKGIKNGNLIMGFSFNYPVVF
jgi:hypothetical protein